MQSLVFDGRRVEMGFLALCQRMLLTESTIHVCAGLEREAHLRRELHQRNAKLSTVSPGRRDTCEKESEPPCMAQPPGSESQKNPCDW